METRTTYLVSILIKQIDELYYKKKLIRKILNRRIKKNLHEIPVWIFTPVYNLQGLWDPRILMDGSTPSLPNRSPDEQGPRRKPTLYSLIIPTRSHNTYFFLFSLESGMNKFLTLGMRGKNVQRGERIDEIPSVE